MPQARISSNPWPNGTGPKTSPGQKPGKLISWSSDKTKKREDRRPEKGERIGSHRLMDVFLCPD